MQLSRIAVLAALVLGVVAPPADAQSRASQANDLVDRLKQPKLSHGEQMRVYSDLLGLGRAGREALAKRWEELSPAQIDWTLTVLARLDPALIADPVVQASQSPNLTVRRAAAGALQDLLATHPEQVREVAQRLLRDPDDAITLDAARCLANLGTRDVWRPLLQLAVSELTHDPETSLRPRRAILIDQLFQTLAELLERHADHSMLVYLFERTAQLKLDSDDAVADGLPALPYPRLFEILGQRPTKLMLPYLRQILAEAYRDELAVIAAAAGGEEEDVDPFRIPDPNLDLALQQVFGEEGEGGIAEDLRPWHPDIRLLALGTVAQLRDPASLPVVLCGMSDPDSRVRSRALDVVGWVMPEDEVKRLACYRSVIPLLVDRNKKLRRQAHRWLTGFSGDASVPQSYNAWNAWLGKAERRVQVEAYLLQFAQEEGYKTVKDLLAARLLRTTEDYLQSLGYETEDEFLADMRADEEPEEGDDDPDE